MTTEIEAMETAAATYQRVVNERDTLRDRFNELERAHALTVQELTLSIERAETNRIERDYYMRRETRIRAALENARALIADQIDAADNERPPNGRAHIEHSPEGERELSRAMLPLIGRNGNGAKHGDAG